MTEMKPGPLVSVGIPVYNCERFLAEAIESVLAQTYRHVEVIVVDDGSVDHSADIAGNFGPRVRYCYQKNSGIGAARNRGLALASGELLAFLDADDCWVKDIWCSAKPGSSATDPNGSWGFERGNVNLTTW